MRIVIVGPGAIGCYLAATLHGRAGRLLLLDHRQDHAAALGESGIVLTTPRGTERARVAVTASPSPGQADVVVLCVKAYDTRTAMRHAAPLLQPRTLVVSLQNGLGNVECIADVAPEVRLAVATTTAGATLEAPGRVLLSNRGRFRLAPVETGGLRPVNDLAALLEAAGLRVAVSGDLEALLWSKLVINAAINAVTAMAGVPNGALSARPDLMETAVAAAREAEAVARGRGIRLDYPSAEAELRRVCRETAGNISSMLQDVRNGKPTEIDAINGAVVREAERLGIDTPVNRRLLEALPASSRPTSN